ncbi:MULTISPECIES: maleylpyruvate isomerase N-terminal domain-containing protein [Streptomycetaceae]|uniref:Mycothiol-dependent maleylpyruvate isomerase metal-binding domain-containing protein n=1 Tax=Streptantibioticus cattleyicolor (strain ATCC 35852 / DSM 46488 / JCM 4925 / NBRC 14057 / NRRL 8057) TaxID=1003195 RepID=F8JV80_STREN|nr:MULTISPECIES: maleylpyruvate isomerase N-terminal domain-containing protein [Streptomycetaceae]AEW93166.1 hypothetical protein SCATT_07950 [Streptantibioticus cattleyicolor NRRL 8057 = DSM 46488]MYS57892.1 hypothetical protein [Streptomyces sp. SID5468]CCB73524.1 conserved protein of unknown function [Streptantibioticus cattleyicolor NRRL 8057 = DSM 46488]
MTSVRKLYLEVAASVTELIAAPEVAAAWDEPSALPKMSVRGLAGHLAGQVLHLPKVLAEPVPVEETISLDEYYARASWIGSDVDDKSSVAVRNGGEEEAAKGPVDLASRVDATVRELRTALLAAPDRPVRRATWGPWSISLDDFVASRLLEMVVHCDDLAYSVGVATPELHGQAVQLVVDVLSRIAVRRHGAVDVLRAFSRAERAPSTIAAL